MYDAILERVKIRLKQFHTEVIDGKSQIVFDNVEDNPLILECIQTNVDFILRRLNKTMNEFEKDEFEAKYASVLVECTLYDCCKEGGEFETSHAENGTDRKWVTKDSIPNSYGVYPFVKSLQ